jgi:hypothetical protein
MNALRPPAVATWLLEHLQSSPSNDSLAGDLFEEYGHGRSRLWYWKQVLAAIVVSACREITAHPVLALRAIVVGWAVWYFYAVAVIPALIVPLARRILPTGWAMTSSPFVITWWALWAPSYAVSGWAVARLHRPHRIAMVLAFAASIFLYELECYPGFGFIQGTLSRAPGSFRYLVFDWEALIVSPLSALLGGLWGALAERDSGAGKKYVAT